MFSQRITETFLNTLSFAEYGAVSVTTPDGKRRDIAGKQAGVLATMNIHDWRTIPAFAAKGDIGLAQAYRDGWWDSDNLTHLMLFGLQNEQALEKYLYGSLFARLATRLMYCFTHNTLKGSRRNIHAHYDLGNDFYALWLDPTMSYSSALFQQADDSLQQAQLQKYDRMLERLEASSGTLLEIGCGWGALAERAVSKYDFGVKAITLSEQQHAYATQRLGNAAQIALEDYRHQEGQYHHILSVEMFEAVGEKYWPTYFEKIKSLLHSKGKAIIQTITIGEPYFERYRSGGDMIRTFIFPGGMLPSVPRFKEESEKAGLRLSDRFAFGHDYARTLEQWLAQFEAKLPQVRELGFDEPFIRIWRFYLASCIASFRVGRTDVMQMELQHA